MEKMTPIFSCQVGRPWEQPWEVRGHEGEVSGVSWCGSDGGQLATCGDDAVVRVWCLNRANPHRLSRKKVGPLGKV